jgi:tetratricopeptide (TPR) repeat protein
MRLAIDLSCACLLTATARADEKTLQLAALERPSAGVASRLASAEVTIRGHTAALAGDQLSVAKRRDLHESRARVYWSVGRREDALADLSAAQKVDPVSLSIQRLLVSYRSGATKDIAHIQQFYKTHPEDSEARLLLA